MESEWPEWWNYRSSNQPMKVCNHFFRVLTTDNKSKIDDASNSPEYFEVTSVAKALNFYIKCVGSTEISHMMKAASFTSQVGGIVSICLFSFSNLACIDNLPVIAIENCPSARLQFEMFWKPFWVSKKCFRIQDSPHLNIIIRKLNLYYWWVKDHCICIFSSNKKTEVIDCKVYLIWCDWNWKGKVGLLIGWEESWSLWNLESILFRIVYFKAEVVVGECLEVEHQLLDHFAFRFDIIIPGASVIKGKFYIWTTDILIDNSVLAIGHCSHADQNK